ncbi:hypothetical protein [Bifidobacterium leontopitheci]|uniref:Uncharacterized protein n=1 Tax=Bifidobacterium leontopitheci TaxID=2650774 RepID=A0A6I1GE75_9BIFI|nr:hypothetical protein [Bifidobacterium leontopitheci]KAB7788992.1 hypothetical protein F7D09_2049 [Bifidobacterium leontopitheci]
MSSASFEAFMEHLRQANDSVSKMRTEVAQIKDEVEKDNERISSQLEERRRSGKSGKAWQILQQRIDMKQTTEDDIMSGVDKSPEAREVRTVMVKNMKALKREMELARQDEHSELGEELRRMDALNEQIEHETK